MSSVEQRALDTMKREPGQQPRETASQYAKRIAVASLREQPEALVKHQPCGCVICTCEEEVQCQGCGAKHCGNRTDHPPYVKQQPEARGVVDDAMVERARQAYKATKRWSTGEYPEGPIRSVADMNRNDDDAWRAALTAAQQPVQEGGGEVCEFEGKACNEVPRGNGYCDRCAAGNYAQCRYTAPPSAPVGVDGCTESNCPRCLTHPDHRGDMAHAGIGGYPTQQPAQAVPGDADVRELLDAMDNGDDPRPAFIRLRKRYPPKSTPPGDDAAGGA